MLLLLPCPLSGEKSARLDLSTRLAISGLNSGFGGCSNCSCVDFAGLWNSARFEVSRVGPGLMRSVRKRRLRAEEDGVLRTARGR